MASAAPFAFDLRVSVLEIEPEIWRLIRVPHDVRMDRFHAVLQVAFGWTDSHLHQYHLFNAEGEIRGYVGLLDPDEGPSVLGLRLPTQPETKRLLKNFLAEPGDHIGYEYDFGDSWLHEIQLAAVQPEATRLTRARCLDGARAGPPEDCGGPPGYDQLLKIVSKPRHREYAAMKEWLGDYDPAAFDLTATNQDLARIKV